MKYFFTAIVMVVFVIFYVWQNIEVMKTRLDVIKLEKVEKEILKKNDSIIYNIEKMRNIDKIISEAKERGLKKIAPSDFIVLKTKDGSGNGNR